MGWWPCSDCCNGGGGDVVPCIDCSTLTVTVTGMADSTAPPLFGSPCGFDNFNTTTVFSLDPVSCDDDVPIDQMQVGGSAHLPSSGCNCSSYSGTLPYRVLYAKVYNGGCPAGSYLLEVEFRWTEVDGFGLRKPATLRFRSSCSTSGPVCTDLTWTLTSADYLSESSAWSFGCGLPIDYSAMTITAAMGV